MVTITSKNYEKIRYIQKELAERAGVTQAHIAKIESNKVNACLSTINKIINGSSI